MVKQQELQKKSTETHKNIQAMDEAIAELSIRCQPSDAARAVPSREMNMDLVKELGNYLKALAPKALIRNGDYPHKRGLLDVSVVLSELADVEKVRDYYNRSIRFMSTSEQRHEETESKLKVVDDAGRDVPTLL